MHASDQQIKSEGKVSKELEKSGESRYKVDEFSALDKVIESIKESKGHLYASRESSIGAKDRDEKQ